MSVCLIALHSIRLENKQFEKISHGEHASMFPSGYAPPLLIDAARIAFGKRLCNCPWSICLSRRQTASKQQLRAGAAGLLLSSGADGRYRSC